MVQGWNGWMNSVDEREGKEGEGGNLRGRRREGEKRHMMEK